MTVTLPPEWEQYVNERVTPDRPADAVLVEALQALQQKEQYEAKLESLRADIAVGIAQLDAGLGIPGPINARKKLEEIRRQRGESCGN